MWSELSMCDVDFDACVVVSVVSVCTVFVYCVEVVACVEVWLVVCLVVVLLVLVLGVKFADRSVPGEVTKLG